MKHLQSNLSTIFSRSIPDLPSIQLPSGLPYIRPMSIAAIQANVVYLLKPYAGIVMLLPTPRVLFSFAHPRYMPRPKYVGRALFIFDDYVDLYFRTSDDAYIHMFLNYPSRINDHPDIYNRIYISYPEYFI